MATPFTKKREQRSNYKIIKEKSRSGTFRFWNTFQNSLCPLWRTGRVVANERPPLASRGQSSRSPRASTNQSAYSIGIPAVWRRAGRRRRTPVSGGGAAAWSVGRPAANQRPPSPRQRGSNQLLDPHWPRPPYRFPFSSTNNKN